MTETTPQTPVKRKGHNAKGHFAKGNDYGNAENRDKARMNDLQLARKDTIAKKDVDAKLDKAQFAMENRNYASEYRKDMLEYIAGRPSSITADSRLGKALEKPNIMAIANMLNGLDDRVNGKVAIAEPAKQGGFTQLASESLPQGDNSGDGKGDVMEGEVVEQ